MKKITIYVRNKKKVPRAVLVAVQQDDNSVAVGYALCNRKDTFTKQKGNFIAIERAKTFMEKSPKDIPSTVKDALPEFITRCKKYFADKTFPAWTEQLN